MASRQVVLLTPLEFSHPRPLPSSHQIKRVHRAFCKKQPFYFQALAGCPFCKSFLLLFINGMGGYPPSRQKSLPYLCSSERRSCSPKSFRRNTYTTSRKCSFQKTYGIANFFRCNTYKKPGGRGHILQDKNIYLFVAFPPLLTSLLLISSLAFLPPRTSGISTFIRSCATLNQWDSCGGFRVYPERCLRGKG